MNLDPNKWACHRCNAENPLSEWVAASITKPLTFTLRCRTCNARHSFRRGTLKLNRERFPERKRRADGTWGCRGCGGDVPKNRRTWCSRECKDRHDPYLVKHAVAVRDMARCQMCGCECKVSWPAWSELGGTWPEYLARKASASEFDHIVPFSEGGPTTADNMRLLCHACHVRRTTEWRRTKRNDETHPIRGL